MTQAESKESKNPPMITHYGLFWSERDVHWGKGGGLQGRPSEPLGRRGAPTTDEKKAFSNYQDFVGLYCLYGDGELLYVGETGLGTKNTLFWRLRQHRKGAMSGRWDHFSWFGRKDCNGTASIKASLGQLEAISIAIINPGFNKKSGTFAGATQVYQVPHDRAEGDLETKLDRLTKMMEDIRKLPTPSS